MIMNIHCDYKWNEKYSRWNYFFIRGKQEAQRDSEGPHQKPARNIFYTIEPLREPDNRELCAELVPESAVAKF